LIFSFAAISEALMPGWAWTAFSAWSARVPPDGGVVADRRPSRSPSVSRAGGRDRGAHP